MNKDIKSYNLNHYLRFKKFNHRDIIAKSFIKINRFKDLSYIDSNGIKRHNRHHVNYYYNVCKHRKLLNVKGCRRYDSHLQRDEYLKYKFENHRSIFNF